jgi:phosphohistidine phosphatase
MRLYLVRHGAAVNAEDDNERVLSENGITRVERTASFLKKNGITVNAIYHSVKTRASQTAEIIAGKIRPAYGPEEREGLKPGDAAVMWAKIINGLNEDVMIVGHLPHLSKLASRLLIDNESEEILTIPDGGALCLERNENTDWRLLWFIHPDIIN